MNQLVFIENGQVVTDSLTVAEVFGKEHKNVVRDIGVQTDKLHKAVESEFVKLNFEPSSYFDKSNRKQFKANLTEEAFTIIAMSYVTPEAMKFKVKFIQEFKRMREKLTNKQHTLPTSFAEALRLAADLEEEKQKLVTKTLMLEQRVAEAEPKVTYFDTILHSTKLVTITQIAKDYGLSGQVLNKILHESGVQYKQSGQWLLYTTHQDKGYTKSQTIIDQSGEARMNTKWTQKGRLFIHTILTNLGFDPDNKKG